MLETFRKHHKIMMIFIAAIVIIAFPFLYQSGNVLGSGAAPVATVNGEPLTGNDVETIGREMGMAQELAMKAYQGGGGFDPNDPVMKLGSLNYIVDSLTPKDRGVADLDGPLNLVLMRQECKRLGIDVEREDVEKTIKTLGAFKTKGTFDDQELNKFLDDGRHGDRSKTEAKLMTLVRDAMLYARLGDLIGGNHTPSPAEIDNDYAKENARTTALTALIERKNHENQTITDEDIKKYYDEEKAKQDAIKPDDKEPKKGADASLLTEEKRTVKYFITTAPKPPDAPAAPVPPPPVAALEDTSKLPEDQKKAKEEEHKKLTDEYNTKKADYDKLVAEHAKALEEHQKKVKETEAARLTWLQKISDLSNAQVAEDRGAKTFEELAKAFGFEAKSATFTKSAPPDDIKAAVVAPAPSPGRPPQGPQYDPAADIFASEKGKDNLQGSPDHNTWCVWVVDAVEAPVMKPMEEVKAAITEKLKTDKIAAALKAAGDDARAKIAEALKTSKTFKEAATAAGLTAAEVPAFSNKKPVDPATPNGSVVKSAADTLNKGELSEVLTVPEGLLLVYVEKKELPNDPKMAEQKKSMLAGRGMKDTNSPLFRAWFLSRRNAATSAQE